MKKSRNMAIPAQLSQGLKDIGEHIARLRKARHLLQAEVGVRAKISRETASRIENGDASVAIGQNLSRSTHAAERYLHLGIGPQGRLATLTNAMGWAARFELTRDKALANVDRVWRVVREWKSRFEEYGVSADEIGKVSSVFRHAREMGGGELGL